jgi:hypothetical protein
MVTVPLDTHPSKEKETLCINEPILSLTIAEQTAQLNPQTQKP